MKNQLTFSLDDSVQKLDINNRCRRILSHAQIVTIGDLFEARDSGRLYQFTTLGKKSLLDIEAILENIRSENKEKIFPTDDYCELDQLDLDIRVKHALLRGNISTIKDLQVALTEERLSKVRGLGSKGIADIKAKIEGIPEKIEGKQAKTLTDVDTYLLLRRICKEQQKYITILINNGLLHEQAKICGWPISYWLQLVNDGHYDNQIQDVLRLISCSSLSLCHELEFLFSNFNPRQIQILILRHGFTEYTLDILGKEKNLTRERIRQIDKKTSFILGRLIRSILNADTDSIINNNWLTLLKIQSVLLLSRDMDFKITNKDWKHEISTSGLLGRWTKEEYFEIDPLEAMFAICKISSDWNIPELEIPENLQLIINPTKNENQKLSAGAIQNIKFLPKEIRKEIIRHTLFVGAVNLKWLSQKLNREKKYLIDVLISMGYSCTADDWYIPCREEETKQNETVTTRRVSVVNFAIKKMLQFCGPLSIDDICGGLRHAVSRTDYSVPPPNIMKMVLESHGYKSTDGLYAYEGESNLELSGGEEVMLACFQKNGIVLHHTEIAQFFIENGYSFPLVHATLKHSPLFHKFDKALYKIRGTKITKGDIERAKNISERTPLNLVVDYDKSGKVILILNLGILAFGTGIIYSEQFPNLTGEWDCIVENQIIGKVTATRTELKQLLRTIRLLKCEIGSRLKFQFNTWNRSVEIEKFEDKQ